MTNYSLQQNETVLFQGTANLKKKNGTTEVILTNLNLVFVTTIKKFLSKSQVDVEKYSVGEVKIYNNAPQIKQKGSSVEIFLTCGEIVADFNSILEAGKFVNAALHLLTGKTMAERGADKFRDAVGLIDDTLGISTVGTVKNVLENGIAGTLLGGFGKRTTSSTKHIFAAKKAMDIAKDTIGHTNSIQSTITSNTVPACTDEQLETIKKLKELVDIGVLTQEEFDAKKKQLLGL